MLFEMVAGYRPYRRHEHNASRLDAAIRRQEAPEPLPADADPVLVAIIRKLLATQIERRYSSADLIVRDLEAYLAGAPTFAATDIAQASVATVRVVPPPIPTVAGPAPSPSVPTEALPRAQPTIATEAIAPPRAKPAKKRSRFRTLVRYAVMFFLLSMVMRECVGLARADRLRERIDGIEADQVAEIRSEYRSVPTGPLGLGAGQVRARLRDRMVALADRSILEFRTGSASVSEVQWGQARDCLAFARELSSRSAIAAKRAYVDAHLVRIAARDRTGFEEAVRGFRESARLDPQAPDPYLGLARIYAYSLREVEPLIDAIKQAEERGFQSGPREQAQIGDAYRFRADRTRAAAAGLSGDTRNEHLASAAEDYGQCIAHFEGLNFFDSENNLRICRRRLTAIVEELHRPDADES